MNDFENRRILNAELERKNTWELAKKDIEEYSQRLREKWEKYFLEKFEMDESEVENIFSLPQEIRTQIYEEYYAKELGGLPLIFDRVMEQMNEDAYDKGADTQSEFEMDLEKTWEKEKKRSIDFSLGEALALDTKEQHVDCDLVLLRMRALGYNVYHSVDNEENYAKEVREMLAKVFYELFHSYHMEIPPELKILFPHKERLEFGKKGNLLQNIDKALYVTLGEGNDKSDVFQEKEKMEAEIRSNIQELYKKFELIISAITVKE